MAQRRPLDPETGNPDKVELRDFGIYHYGKLTMMPGRYGPTLYLTGMGDSAHVIHFVLSLPDHHSLTIFALEASQE